MRRAGLIPFLLLALTVRPLGAQWQASLDFGLSRLEQIGIPESGAQTFGASVDAFGSRFAVGANGLLTRASMERWTAQGLVGASVMGRVSPRVSWDVTGTTSAFAEVSAQTASSAELLARGHFGTPAFGSSLGFGGGTRRADAGRQPMGRLLATTWLAMGWGRAGAELSHVRTSTTPFPDRPRIGLNYTDASVTWRGDRGRLNAGIVLGVRTSNNAIVPDGGWGALDVTASLTPHLSLVAGAGQSPQDVVRGVPRIRYASIALRIGLRPRVSPAPIVHASDARPHLAATRDGVDVRVDSASTVELMADFTEWKPVALARAGDVWRLARAVTPGLHRVMIRIDGGEWRTPANLPAAADELGGMVGVVSVP